MAATEAPGAGQRLLPDHAPRVQSRARRVLRVVRARTAARLHQGDRERLARCAGSPRARRRFHQRADHGGAQAGGRSRRQRAAGARTGQRDHAGEGRRVQGHPARELAFRPAGADAAERAGRRPRPRGCATARSWRCSWAAGCGGPRWRRSRWATSSSGMAGGASWISLGSMAGCGRFRCRRG